MSPPSSSSSSSSSSSAMSNTTSSRPPQARMLPVIRPLLPFKASLTGGGEGGSPTARGARGSPSKEVSCRSRQIGR
jgi:hypothetical protein